MVKKAPEWESRQLYIPEGSKKCKAFVISLQKYNHMSFSKIVLRLLREEAIKHGFIDD